MKKNKLAELFSIVQEKLFKGYKVQSKFVGINASSMYTCELLAGSADTRSSLSFYPLPKPYFQQRVAEVPNNIAQKQVDLSAFMMCGR